MTVHPRLYLDVDGCIFPFSAPDPSWGPSESASIEVSYGAGHLVTYDVIWAPALINALDQLRAEFDLELVWVTTWNDADAARTLIPSRLNGLFEGRALFRDVPRRIFSHADGNWKALQILEDQAASPAPFIWVDDAEVELRGWKVLAATRGTASLMIPPHPMVGLRTDDVHAIRKWLQQHNS